MVRPQTNAAGNEEDGGRHRSECFLRPHFCHLATCVTGVAVCGWMFLGGVAFDKMAVDGIVASLFALYYHVYFRLIALGTKRAENFQAYSLI